MKTITLDKQNLLKMLESFALILKTLICGNEVSMEVLLKMLKVVNQSIGSINSGE